MEDSEATGNLEAKWKKLAKNFDTKDSKDGALSMEQVSWSLVLRKSPGYGGRGLVGAVLARIGGSSSDDNVPVDQWTSDA